ncbi:sigma-70 region 2 domain protein [Alloactinosynnema sp. L-07]|uniref:sigma-70 family RNA polymerase sigma factor n=1 Tax=Alloactinosynnema sp. L-07 TaxID=1653480 RepID=UPI00065EF925|nr:sigma-70 family RNA polymerase sigma factor [Alloactinosynnema sp. L-07]CRK59766.1 sigma-70 region 2 domain protein [Alloactinosynnema sp. L-07]
MSTVPADLDGPSDAELIDSVRAGTVSAYGSLYERHVGAARNLARQLTRSPAEADDLVSEAFAKVLDTLRQGRGPDSAFRAYLLTALRHTAYDKTRRDKKVELSDDVSQVSGVNPDQVAVPFSDTAVAGLERSLAARAFAMLPERWQAVLWHTEIEGQNPAQVAPILGLTPNGVSALAYRAREGLRQAYLQVHLAENSSDRCRATADRLGAWVRGGLSKRETAQVELHLDDCERCRALSAELADINTGLRLNVAPLVLGFGAAAGYLALAKAAAGTAAIATAGAATAGAAGGAAGAAASAPRQFLGVAASGVALAAAVAVGLAASPTGQQIPAAAPAPVTATPQPPAPPPPAPPAPPAAEPPKPAPADPPATIQPKPTTAAPAPEQPVPPPAPEPTPNPAPANLSAAGPATPISLTPGGGPVDLPITVRNTGGSLSEPISATLSLPTGVRAIPATANRLTGDPLLRFDAPLLATQRTDVVRCPGGTGSVTCGTTDGLRPGDAVTLMFRLVADPDATGGQVTGTVSAGRSLTVNVVVPVEVRPPPTVDKVDVRAMVTTDDWFTQLWPWQREILLKVTMTNTGTSTKPVSLNVDEGGSKISATGPITCGGGHSAIDCATGPMAPGAKIDVVFRIGRGPDHPHDGKARKITVTAVLGSARDTATVWVPWAHGPWWSSFAPPATNTKPTKTTTTKPVPTTTADPVDPTQHRPPAPPNTTTTPPNTRPAKPTTSPSATPEPGSQPTPICVGGNHKPKRWDVPC